LTGIIQALTKQADALVPKMIEGLEEVDLTSSEGKEFMSILSALDKSSAPNSACSRQQWAEARLCLFRGRAWAAISGQAAHEG